MLKKVLALLTALAIVFSMGAVTVFAADEGEVGGTGDTKYVKTDEFAVLLPTADNWNFYLDPQGLIGAKAAGLFDNDAFATAGQLEEYAGKIISGIYAPVAVNKSSYEMTLGVEIKVVGDDIITVDSEGDFTSTDNQIVLNALLAENFATSGTTFATSATTKEVPLDKAGQTLKFVLEAPEYVFAATSGNSVGYEYKLGAGEEGYGTQLQLGGSVNEGADWSAYVYDAVKNPTPKEVSIDAKFTLAKSSPEELEETPDPNAYGYIGTSTLGAPATAISWTGLTANGSSSVTTTELTLTFDVDPTGLDAGDITVNGATKGLLTDNGDKTYTLAISDITVADGADVTVTLANPTGYTISGSPKTVAVHVAAGTSYGFPGLTKTINLSVGATAQQVIPFTFPAGTVGTNVVVKNASNQELVRPGDYTVSVPSNNVTFTASRVTMLAATAGNKVFTIVCEGVTYTLTFVVA